MEAILEIGHIYGIENMKKLAKSLDRTFESNIPSIQKGQMFETIVDRFHSEMHCELVRSSGMGYMILRRLMELDYKERATADEALKLIEAWESHF